MRPSESSRRVCVSLSPHSSSPYGRARAPRYFCVFQSARALWRPPRGRKKGAKRARSGPAAPPNSWPRGHPPALRGGSNAQARLRNAGRTAAAAIARVPVHARISHICMSCSHPQTGTGHRNTTQSRTALARPVCDSACASTTACPCWARAEVMSQRNSEREREREREREMRYR